ncbi:MAG TPA: alcohol dehydrogenase catalytic domain-containing protein [Candidatus Baltobacteraceae bacterium]|nr:alcohol dehydrogenase catalytic domain-containing protein [Candidatus Baltobacteraceae bacterium]
MASNSMKAAVLVKPETIEIREMPRPTAGPGEVLIRVRAAGICGSDMHLYDTGRLGPIVLQNPHVPGHEMSGEIAAVGSGVTTLQVGQRVVLEPGFACGNCKMCRSGRYNLCGSVRFLGVPPNNGCMAEYVVAPAQWVYPMPDALSFSAGATVEPLVVGLQAAAHGRVGPESVVAIFGAGMIGLVCLEAALSHGAEHIWVIDVMEQRLALAKELGAQVINARGIDVVQELKRQTGGGPDVIMEATGAPPAITSAFKAAAKGATFVAVGFIEEQTMALDYTAIVRSGLRIETLFRYANLFPLAIDVSVRRRERLARFVTDRFPLEKAADAFATAHARGENTIKVMVEME